MGQCRTGRRAAALLLWAAALLCALAPPGAHARNLTVFAAASLKNALDDIDARYGARGGARTAVSYASSSALARQVESGAPADIFISADLDWMDYLEQRRLVRAETRTNLLRNELVLAAPAGGRACAHPLLQEASLAAACERGALVLGPRFPLAALLGAGRLAMGDPDHVPAGKYGKAALERLELWRSVAARIARAENVRAALVFVARGEAPLGIVYRTDAAADRNVRIVAVVPAHAHPPIVYPAAVLAGSRSPAAEEYLSFLKSAGAAGIFRTHGFIPY